MANMGYCRFENTLSDLRDCLNHLDDEVESREAVNRFENTLSDLRDCLNHLDDEVESREAVNLFGLLPDPINEGG